jgi:hypothetical protein
MTKTVEAVKTPRSKPHDAGSGGGMYCNLDFLSRES